MFKIKMTDAEIRRVVTDGIEQANAELEKNYNGESIKYDFANGNNVELHGYSQRISSGELLNEDIQRIERLKSL